MIAKLPPLITGCLVSALCAFSAFTGRTAPKTPPALISGELYSAKGDHAGGSTAALDAQWQQSSSLPSLTVSLDPAAKASLPAGSDFAVHFVGAQLSTFTLTLSAPIRKVQKRAQVKPIIEIAPPPAPAPEIVQKPAEPIHKIEDEKPASPATFAQFDEALRDSRTTQTVNLRTKNTGVTFRITHIGRIDDRGAIRYAVTNQEAADFFLSIINITANGKAVPAETLGSFVARVQTEIFGVVHFPAAAAGKSITVELVQSGGERRRFELPVEFAF